MLPMTLVSTPGSGDKDRTQRQRLSWAALLWIQLAQTAGRVGRRCARPDVLQHSQHSSECSSWRHWRRLCRNGQRSWQRSDGQIGDDTYVVSDSDQGVVNELGDLMGGGVSSADSVQFELAMI